ncbi:MAG: four helix bundle protein [Bacteroidota bacterium]
MGREKRYDLEDRTKRFAIEVAGFLKAIPKTIENVDYCRQLLRSSSAVGANYIEANESLGKKDFLMRIRICRKEAKETRYWLELLSSAGGEQNVRQDLIRESTELMKIFGAIIQKSL